MKALIIVVAVLLVVALIVLSLSIRVVTQYEKGVLFRLGKVVGVKDPGLAVIIPVIDRLMKVSLRIVTMPIQSQGIITRDKRGMSIWEMCGDWTELMKRKAFTVRSRHRWSRVPVRVSVTPISTSSCLAR